MGKRIEIQLTAEDRAALKELTKRGKVSARKLNRARVLLLADAGRSEQEVAQILGTSGNTIWRTKVRYREGGLEWALNEEARSGAPRKLDGRQEAFLVALACSEAPSGRDNWTMQLLADRVVELGIVDSISDETVRTTLKKNKLKPWQKEQWCIPTISNDFVWHMEDILDLYALPYDPAYPQVCFDERPVQLLDDVREPQSARPGVKRRFDYEYHREGTCNLFMFFQPLQSGRHVKVTDRRTKLDFAQCMKELVDIHFPTATCIRVVLDNLNIHTFASFYEAFDPAEARRIMRKLEFHFTPKHGSWLNMVEIELSVLSRQCLQRRIPDQQRLQFEVDAWANQRNAQQATIHWRFSTQDARTKLAYLYP
jgi:transposase